MKKFFTSDTHLGGLVNRTGFKSQEHFVQRIITGINQRVKPQDVLYMVGDFVSYGNVGHKDDAGQRVVAENLRYTAEDYLVQINAQVILIEGNHDYNNKVKPQMKWAFVDIGRYVAFVSHYPTDSQFNAIVDHREQARWHRIVDAAAVTADFAIVGHIHDAPRVRRDRRTGLININVAVDVRNWLPVSSDEILRDYREFKD